MEKHTEIDVLTGEITVRDYTEEELIQLENDRFLIEKEEKDRAKTILEKEKARSILLERLGITEEEASLLR